jgi:MYXO-CTERM domain-containing protein
LFSAGAQALVVPQSALTTSNYYYTDLVGGGLGPNVVTTGGGNAANVGQADGRNDDGYMALNLGFDVSFFGSTYTSLFINNNGNLSFGGGISNYIPTGPTGANEPIISALFADVDTRSPLSGVVHYRTDIPNELIVTWDQVGSFSSHGAALDSFQVVLRGVNYAIPVGEGTIGFFYKQMGWDVADTSATAAVGFGNGAGNSEVLQGSNTPGMAAVLNDEHVWFDQRLAPVPDPSRLPEPTSLALAGLGLAALLRRRGK